MSLIKFKKILSCSSEDRVHCSKNLLQLDQTKKWLSSKGTDERIICILEFDKPSFISSIDIGNFGSAFIELFVCQSSKDDWIILLPSTNLMSLNDSYLNENFNQIKTFKPDILYKKWNRLKIICEQKFNNIHQFGLNFIKLYSNENEKFDNQIQIMKNVIFVLNDLQNPLRSELYDKATSMGAIYNENWNEKCTHLICTCSNTSKLTQIKQTRKTFIVNQQWILDCYEQKQFLSEKSYELKRIKKRKTKNEDESDIPKDIKRRNLNKKNIIIENEEKLKVGEIPDFFHDIHFYVSYGDYNDHTLLDIIRVILAYDGILERQINSNVKYVITNRMWNQNFEKISKSNPDLMFVNLDWLQDCHDTNQFVPVDPYLIVR